MDGAINFTIGLSEGIAWPWPIAVYLFLAGISGGAVAVALMLNFFRHKTETTPIIKSASIIGLATILLGMLCLVLDLTNPLYFWRILVYYNPTSVMSIGVMLLLFYIPLIASLIAGKNTESKVSFYFAGTCAIAGMMCLRLFILYAGQMNTIV